MNDTLKEQTRLYQRAVADLARFTLNTLPSLVQHVAHVFDRDEETVLRDVERVAAGNAFRSRPRNPVTVRRLADGARAILLSALATPKSADAIRERLTVIYDGMLALQSLDDLGEEDNKRAASDLAKLEQHYAELNKKLKDLT